MRETNQLHQTQAENYYYYSGDCDMLMIGRTQWICVELEKILSL